jgi:hypothetical protein
MGVVDFSHSVGIKEQVGLSQTFLHPETGSTGNHGSVVSAPFEFWQCQLPSSLFRERQQFLP